MDNERQSIQRIDARPPANERALKIIATGDVGFTNIYQAKAEECPDCHKTSDREVFTCPYCHRPWLCTKHCRTAPTFLEKHKVVCEDCLKLLNKYHYADYKKGEPIDDRYKVKEVLGWGGSGKVFLVQDLWQGGDYVLKFLNRDFARTPGDELLLKQEAHSLNQLRHPNIIFLWNLDKIGDGYVLKLEYASGGSLADRIANRNALGQFYSVSEVLEVMAGVCEGLQYAHQQKIVHCDLKPANIAFGSKTNEAPKILDFGFSRIVPGSHLSISDDVSVSGTRLYMAPEHFHRRIGVSCDIYSLGCIIYEMLSGYPPFSSDGGIFREKHGDPDEIETLTLPINKVLRRFLEREPKDRPKSAKALYAELKLAAETIACPVCGSWEMDERFVCARCSKPGLCVKHQDERGNCPECSEVVKGLDAEAERQAAGEQQRIAAFEAQVASLIGVGDSKCESGNWEDAISFYVQAYKLRPTSELHEKIVQSIRSRYVVVVDALHESFVESRKKEKDLDNQIASLNKALTKEEDLFSSLLRVQELFLSGDWKSCKATAESLQRVASDLDILRKYIDVCDQKIEEARLAWEKEAKRKELISEARKDEIFGWPSNSIERISEALLLGPTDPDLIRNLRECIEEDTAYDAAIKVQKELSKRKDDATALIEEGDRLFDKCDYEAAKDCYKRALALDAEREILFEKLTGCETKIRERDAREEDRAGDRAFASKDWSNAIKYYRKAFAGGVIFDSSVQNYEKSRRRESRKKFWKGVITALSPWLWIKVLFANRNAIHLLDSAADNSTPLVFPTIAWSIILVALIGIEITSTEILSVALTIVAFSTPLLLGTGNFIMLQNEPWHGYWDTWRAVILKLSYFVGGVIVLSFDRYIDNTIFQNQYDTDSGYVLIILGITALFEAIVVPRVFWRKLAMLATDFVLLLGLMFGFAWLIEGNYTAVSNISLGVLCVYVYIVIKHFCQRWIYG